MVLMLTQMPRSCTGNRHNGHFRLILKLTVATHVLVLDIMIDHIYLFNVVQR